MPTRNFLSRLAGVVFCIFVGFMLATYFQFTLALNYEYGCAAYMRHLAVNVQPYHEARPMKLFGDD